MSQINNTAQHQEIVSILDDNALSSVTGCWLGAYGFFLPVNTTTLVWTWAEPFRNIPWDADLAVAMSFELNDRADTFTMQGLLTRRTQSGDWEWTHANHDFLGQNARRCAACMDVRTLSPSCVCALHL